MELQSMPKEFPEPFFPDNISQIETCSSAQPKKKSPFLKYGNYLGGMHMNYPLYFFIPLLIFACLYSLHMSVKQKQERPYPHATITNTACHYPQDIVFRFLMLPAGSFIVLTYYVAFEWLKKTKKRIEFPFGVQAWLQKWAIGSVIGFYCAIGTIDSAGYPSIHGIGAVFFFIILYVTAGTITIVMRELYNWDPTVIHRNSLITKILVTGYITAVALYCGVGALLENEQNDDDIYLVIIEWNLTIGGLVWLLTFTLDWRNVFIVLRGDISKTVKVVA